MDVKISVKDVQLQTPRLLIRGVRETDAQEFFDYAKVEGVGEAAGWRHHEDIETTRKVLASFLESDDVFALVNRSDSRFIGTVGIHEYEPDAGEYSDLAIKEIGYALARDFWGMGLMTEAVCEIIRWAFRETEIQALSCGHFLVNGRSRRVIEKCGFSYWRPRIFDARQLGTKEPGAEYILLKHPKQPL